MHVRQAAPLVALILLAGCSSLLGPTAIVRHFLDGAKHGDTKAMYECLAGSQRGGLDGLRAFREVLTNNLEKPRWVGGSLESNSYSLFFSSPTGYKIVSTDVMGSEASIIVELQYTADRAPVFVSAARVVAEPTYYGVQPIFWHPGGDSPLGPRYRTDPDLSKEAEFDRKRIVLTYAPIKTVRLEFRATCDLVKHWWISEIKQPYSELPGQPLALNEQALRSFTLYPARSQTPVASAEPTPQSSEQNQAASSGSPPVAGADEGQPMPSFTDDPDRGDTSFAYEPAQGGARVPSGHRLFVRLFNEDDRETVVINGVPALTGHFQEDTGHRDLTGFCRPGENRLVLQVNNSGSGYTWGFDVRLDDQEVFHSEEGRQGYGARDDDHTQGIVFRREIPFVIEADSEPDIKKARVQVVRVGPPPKSYSGDPPKGVEVYHDEELVLVKSVPPRYPDLARRNAIEGTVVVEALVGTDGRTGKLAIVTSIPTLDEAALEAVKQYLFKPAMANHKPVAMWVEIPVRFKLAEEHR